MYVDMIKFLIDLVRFPAEIGLKTNRFQQLLDFVLIDYPAYLRSKPSIGRIVLFPFLLVLVIWRGN